MISLCAFIFFVCLSVQTHGNSCDFGKGANSKACAIAADGNHGGVMMLQNHALDNKKQTKQAKTGAALKVALSTMAEKARKTGNTYCEYLADAWYGCTHTRNEWACTASCDSSCVQGDWSHCPYSNARLANSFVCSNNCESIAPTPVHNDALEGLEHLLFYALDSDGDGWVTGADCQAFVAANPECLDCIQQLEGQPVTTDAVCAQFNLQDDDNAIDIDEFLAVLPTIQSGRYTALMQMLHSHQQGQASANAEEETHGLAKRSSMESVNFIRTFDFHNSLTAKGCV